jgi:hypothetical protein
MKSSKWILGLMAMVLVMAFSSSSFAQISIQLFNTPSASEIKTNHLAQTADPTSVGAGILVSGSIIASSTLTTTYLTLNFPAPITSSTTTYDGLYGPPGSNPAPVLIPANDPITIQGATGLFASITAVYTVDVKNGQVVITLPGTVGLGLPGNSNTLSGSFRLIGVRVDAAGKTAPLTVTASLSSSANNYINAATPQTLISALGDGIATFSQSAAAGAPNNGTALIFSNQTTAFCSNVVSAPNYSSSCTNDTTATFSLTEGFASAWRSALQSSVAGTALANGSNILLTIAGLPSGISATLSQDVTGASTTVAIAGGSATFGPGTAANTATISFTNTNLTAAESLQFDITLTGTPVGALTAGTITLSATMTPNATSGLSSSGKPNENGPNFVVATLGPITIGNIVSANTTMLVPYVVKTGPYDTGIAIANTTMDPFGGSGGGATPQAGTMTFTLYPRTATGAGTAISVTTSATKIFGAGLATDGTLVAGGTWTGLLSDILTAAGTTGDFFGYIFIQANFLDAHGAGYIFNGAGFTSSTPVLVLGPPAGSPRTANVESLNN